MGQVWLGDFPCEVSVGFASLEQWEGTKVIFILQLIFSSHLLLLAGAG